MPVAPRAGWFQVGVHAEVLGQEHAGVAKEPQSGWSEGSRESMVGDVVGMWQGPGQEGSGEVAG